MEEDQVERLRLASAKWRLILCQGLECRRLVVSRQTKHFSPPLIISVNVSADWTCLLSLKYSPGAVNSAIPTIILSINGFFEM
jgi:hypothetical protein